MKPIMIVATTWFPDGDVGKQRREAFARAAQSWHGNLRYDDGPVHLHIADDGTNNVPPTMTGWKRGQLSSSVQRRRGVGASFNAGVFAARASDALILHAVDDWELLQILNLTPWARLLEQNEGVGAVRLGPPHPDLTGKVTAYEQGWAMLLNRHNFVFSFRPTLFHTRMFDHYGTLPEECSALDAERVYNDRVCGNETGPVVVLALPDMWEHINTTELSAVTP